MKKHFVVRLTVEETEHLQGLVNRGREAAYRRRHAQVLLLVDEGEQQGSGLIDREAAERVGFTRRTVEKIRERCVSEGLAAALERKKGGARQRKLDGDEEAKLVTLACSTPPSGQARWSLRLISRISIKVLNYGRQGRVTLTATVTSDTCPPY